MAAALTYILSIPSWIFPAVPRSPSSPDPSDSLNVSDHPSRSSLATALKDGTHEEHKRAERAVFVTSVLRGDVDVRKWARFLTMLASVYRSLEDALEQFARHPAVSPIHYPRELYRHPSIVRDLTTISQLVRPPLTSDELRSPAAERYSERIDRAAREGKVHLLAAHAYVRYLGDLSGGRMMGARVKKGLVGKALREAGEDGATGLEFFEFSEVGDVKIFKDSFRRGLDEIGNTLSSVEFAETVCEAELSFKLNTDMFEELSGDASL
ncbi:hypothetical protein HDU93_005884 [Gonapodya sp. JEL0774]|nr:hypothetical protein HDU93_005884 [Gonapodya sp. JEL0774]